MGFEVGSAGDEVRIRLSRLDRLFTWRRQVVIDRAAIVSAAVIERGDLEELIDHRVLGTGTHSGALRPNRRRVGIMEGRDVVGRQFWAVPASDGTKQLLVLDLRDHDFVRAVLAVADPDAMAADLRPST